jgi:hypothetical protein
MMKVDPRGGTHGSPTNPLLHRVGLASRWLASSRAKPGCGRPTLDDLNRNNTGSHGGDAR